MKNSKIQKKHSMHVILFGDSIIPRCIPFYYRLHLLLCKLHRSIKRKLFSCFSNQELSLDERVEESDRILNLGKRKVPFINKTFSSIEDDLKIEKMRNIIQKINELKEILKEKKLRFTTAAGSFKLKDFIPEKEHYKLWENAWILTNSKVDTQDIVLDVGGASTIFSYLLAYIGCEVYVVDNDWGNHGIVYNARFVSAKIGWRMRLFGRDASRKLPFRNNFFDKIFCICVLEHLTPFVRRKLMQEINRVLKPGGIVGLTFDYDADRNTPHLDKGIRYSLRKRLINDIIDPSSLEIYGNARLVDDCSSQFFLGSLFLTKPKVKA